MHSVCSGGKSFEHSSDDLCMTDHFWDLADVRVTFEMTGSCVADIERATCHFAISSPMDIAQKGCEASRCFRWVQTNLVDTRRAAETYLRPGRKRHGYRIEAFQFENILYSSRPMPTIFLAHVERTIDSGMKKHAQRG